MAEGHYQDTAGPEPHIPVDKEATATNKLPEAPPVKHPDTNTDLNSNPKASTDKEDVAAKAAEKESGAEVGEEKTNAESSNDELIPLAVSLPGSSEKISIVAAPHEQINEIRQTIQELPAAVRHSCFHLEHNGNRINDFTVVSSVQDIRSDPELRLVLDPYTEKEARLHFFRIRELIGAAGDRTDTFQGILAGASIFDSVLPNGPAQRVGKNDNKESHKHSTKNAARHGSKPGDKNGTKTGETQKQIPQLITKYDFNSPANPTLLVPSAPETGVKTVKTICLSPWNPPPPHLRQRGHLLYISVTTLEGEQYQITSHVGGFYVNRSTNMKFDPAPRPSPKSASSHSLMSLLEQISPSFPASFARLQEQMNRKDPLATYQITHSTPMAPWIVPPPTANVYPHQPDVTRPQESYLISGIDNNESLRDWNEEVQSARELPKEQVPDRIFRERLSCKLYADYTDAAVKGAVLVARGEVPPLNPTEEPDAQIFVYNNVFFSFGADGVKTFTSDGGDEAARAATGKDVMGVRLANQQDIEGLFIPATVVVDYLGRRIVGQSIVPGIFKQKEPGENQIDYGAVEGKDVVACDERFEAPFAKLSAAFKVKKHPVWDKQGKRHDLAASLETKGLLGTDGRKYVLDLYRLTPLDIAWIEECWQERPRPDVEVKDQSMIDAKQGTKTGMKDAAKSKKGEKGTKPASDPADDDTSYPHRLTVLRPELIDAYGRHLLRKYIGEQHQKNKEKMQSAAVDTQKKEGETPSAQNDSENYDMATAKIDLSGFSFALNPDVFSGQTPQTDEEKAETEADEKEVRLVCEFLRKNVMYEMLVELKASESSFPIDGRSLTRMLHKRGINVRYLGRIISLCESPHLDALKIVCITEVVSRCFKHVATAHLKHLPLALSTSCISHLLNCLLGSKLNPKPVAEVDESLSSLYNDVDLRFTSVTPESLRRNIEQEAFRRFRHKLEPGWLDAERPLQLLREVALKLGLQMQNRLYRFNKEVAAQEPQSEHGSAANGHGEANGQTTSQSKDLTNGHANGTSNSNKKKKKKTRDSGSPSSSTVITLPLTTFCPDDIVNVVPVIKDSSPRSMLADDILETGRSFLAANKRPLAQEYLLQALDVHEQIYGILHPEMARAYHQLALLYFQLEEKEAAIDLARKAIIVAERTIGLDAEETLLNYLNLGLFLHQANDSASALVYAQHALEIWKIMYGPNHPDSVTTINNAAVMLQSLKAYHESRLWFEQSLKICEQIFGAKSLNSATLLFQLAQALALDNDASGAVTKMRASYAIFKEELGPNDKNTKEAELWLDQLTQSAVAIRKNAKELEARRLNASIKFPIGN